MRVKLPVSFFSISKFYFFYTVYLNPISPNSWATSNMSLWSFHVPSPFLPSSLSLLTTY